MKKIFSLGLSLFLFLFVNVACPRASMNENLDDLRIGNLDIKVIRDANVTMEKSLVPDLNKHPEYQQVFQNGPVEAVDQVFYFEDGPRKVLIDTGWGDNNKIKGETLQILQEEGVRPGQITDIIMTHLDYDHSGGLLKNGKKTFPNAKVHISRPEYDAWKAGNIENRPEFAKEMNKKILNAYKDQITTFAFGEEVIPGVTAMDISGHTPGHTGYQIKSGNDELVVVGDMIHIAPIQLPLPEVSTVYDIDMEKAANNRAKVLDSIANSGATMAGMHFPEISTVIKRPDHGYAVKQAR